MSTKRLLILGAGAVVIVVGAYVLFTLPAQAPSKQMTETDVPLGVGTTTGSVHQPVDTTATDTTLPSDVAKKDTTTTDPGLVAAVSARTVTLTAPTDVMQKFASCTYAFGFTGTSGNSLTVEWGDGVREPDDSFGTTEAEHTAKRGTSCTNVVSSHTYTSPGTYTITVRSWHPGPTDMAITDWNGTATVTIK